MLDSSSFYLFSGTSQSLKDDLAFQKLSLQFLCCTSSNFGKICMYLQAIVSHYIRCCKNKIDTGTSEVFYSIFKCISDKLETLSNREKCAKLVSEYRCTIYRVQMLLIEYLLSVSAFRKAKAVSQDMKVSCGNSPLCKVLVDLSSYTVSATEAFKNSQQVDISSEQIQEVNSELTNRTQTESFENLKLVFRTLESFLHTVSKVLGDLDTSLIKVLLESCTLTHVIYEKLDAGNIWEDDTKEVKKKTKDVKKRSSDTKEAPTKKQDFVQGRCQVYYRQLTLQQKLLVTDTGNELSLCYHIKYGAGV